tara:strand:- start:980 stop:1729 length:750 start_codon:yes stop_codon:yes gene_type:complete
MRNSYKIGNTFVNNQGLSFTIVDVITNDRCKIRFDHSKYDKIVYKTNIRRGEVKDDTYTCGGKGYFDMCLSYIQSPVYTLWSSIFFRCYNENQLKKRPTYKGCTVCPEWCVFSNFYKWYTENYVDGWHLDKDLKKKGNKVYCPAFCMFIPQELNSITVLSDGIRGDLPVGVGRSASSINPYKAEIRWTENGVRMKKHLGCFSTVEETFSCYRSAKLQVIKEKANRYYTQGVISCDTRDIILRYDISIED